MKEHFVFLDPEFNQCHGSSIIETEHGLFMSCFAGPREGHEKTAILGALFNNEQWCDQRLVIDSKQECGSRIPLWNPVLYRLDDELRLYYRIGKSPENWSCAFVSSFDHSMNWSKNTLLPPSITGPVRNKPILTKSGRLIVPTSTEAGNWSIHFELSEDGGANYRMVNVKQNSIQAIQPVIIQHENKILQVLCRTRNSYIAEAWSYDDGLSWSELTLTNIRNPNAAIDALRIENMGYLLVYNDCRRGRCNLTVAASADGHNWVNKLELENSLGEFSYPCMEVTQDGSLHILYTYNRKNIKHKRYLKDEVNQLFQFPDHK